MSFRYFVALGFLTLFLSGCYLPINGRVLDAETNQPIEGAVVLVEWTKTIGYGLTHTESYKVAEALSDKDGKFNLPGCYSPLVNAPDVTIYKKKYVAWNSKTIFPNNQKRDNYKWVSSVGIKLEKFKDTYSYDDHYYYIVSAARLESATDQKRLFIKVYDEWERAKAIKERSEKLGGGGRK